MASAVLTDGLTKDFSIGFWRARPHRALDRLSLDIPSGAVFSLLGPNGSGKSTTLKLLLGLIRPTAGRAEVLGRPPQSAATRRRIGFLPENPAFYDHLTAEELVTYFAGLVQHYGRERQSTRLEGRFELLYPLLDVATSLDPDFTTAYRFGAVLLAEPPPAGPGRVDQAVALLQKGLRHDPERWQFAFDLGFIYYWHGSGTGPENVGFLAAADWFERAAQMPLAPVWLSQLAATTRARGGDIAAARRLLQELATSEAEWIQRAARRSLDRLAGHDPITRLVRPSSQFLLPPFLRAPGDR